MRSLSAVLVAGCLLAFCSTATAAPRLSNVSLPATVHGLIYGGGLSPFPGWCEADPAVGRVGLKYTASAPGKLLVTVTSSRFVNGFIPSAITQLPMRQGANDVNLLPSQILKNTGIDPVTITFTLWLVPVDRYGAPGALTVKRIRMNCG